MGADTGDVSEGERMNGEMLSWISSSLRVIFITLINIDTALFVTGKMLGKRRSIWELRIYFLIKILVQLVGLDYLAQFSGLGEAEFYLIQAMVVFTFAILNYVMCYRVFDGSFMQLSIIIREDSRKREWNWYVRYQLITGEKSKNKIWWNY